MPRPRESPPPPARGHRPALALGLASLLAVPLALWWLTHRAEAGARSPAAAEPEASSREGTPESAVVAVRTAAERAPMEPAPGATALAPATISGRLQLDGYAPYSARVQMRQDGGDWERAVVVDDFGRFWAEGVPAARILLAFELEGMESSLDPDERTLVLPNEYAVDPAAGEVELVDLDWRTRHVNVHVVTGEELPLRRSRLEITGPGYRAIVDTNDAGKRRLSLVGSGLFTFRAVLASGQVGVSEVELEDGEDLDTVVIAAER